MTRPDPWNTGILDLAAYLRRVGVPRRRPSRGALDELHRAHVRTFTFENIDVLLGQHPGVELADVQEKFLRRDRGGYCFEHSTLLAAALDRLGYHVIRRLGRVGDPTGSARLHMVVEVVLDGERLLADPGFGMSILRPIAMRDGLEDHHGGWTNRLLRIEDPGGTSWELQRHRTGGWERMHTTDELTVHPADVAAGHHYTSTHPDSRFLNTLVLARFLDDGSHATVTHESVTVRRAGASTEHRPLRDGELDSWLETFSLDLTPAERDLLGQRIGSLPAPR